MEELLKRPRSILMLRALYERSAMNVRTFDFYAEMTPRNSRSLREWMESKGLIVVKLSPTRRSSDKLIDLTPEGRALWELFRQSAPILKAAEQRAARAAAAKKQRDEKDKN